MKDNVKLYFTIEDLIKKYKNNYWSKSDDTYLLSNVDSMEYSIIARILNKSHDDVIYRIIKNILYKEYIDDNFNKKYRSCEVNRILRIKYKLEYLTDKEIDKIFKEQ
jgi:hypothetical protein